MGEHHSTLMYCIIPHMCATLSIMCLVVAQGAVFSRITGIIRRRVLICSTKLDDTF